MPDAENNKLPVDVDTVIENEKTHVRPKSKELGERIQRLKRSPGAVELEESREEVDRRSALCLSGGGIRSAAIALGFLQACDSKKLLKKFDYLFTVSGGGYIGGWLTALMHRLKQHDEDVV